MRIDKKLNKLPLTPEQHFFASCWYNMVHAYSLDSYRVRAMNPGNGLRELHRMLSPPASNSDLSLVAAELQRLLQTDPALSDPPFCDVRNELVELLDSCIGDKQKNCHENKPLIFAFSSELLRYIQDEYIGRVLDYLNRALITDVGSVSADVRNSHIQSLTGNLLSTLLDRGASIESLFQLYRQILCGSKPGKQYVFEKKFGLLVRLILVEPRRFDVVFAIDMISNTDDFPKSIGMVTFDANPPVAGAGAKPPVLRYLTAQPKRLFAQVSVETKDYRTAGTEAYANINSILDLVRFEYEREKVHMQDEFVISDGNAANVYRIFPIPKVVPNPTTSIDGSGLQGFIDSVNELMASPHFVENGRDRVKSAFRLYRIGSDTHIFENKLVSWWTAIEYLVKGGGGMGGIGDVVENTLAPVLCLGYIDKLLQTFRNALVDVNAVITKQGSSVAIRLKECTSVDIYELFKDRNQHAQLLGVATDPYLRHKLGEFITALSTPENIVTLLEEHEKRLRWHIQRIYRARCDIVHSAEVIVNAALLCANLEYYLKTTLTMLLREIRVIPHMSGPKEFFDRKIYAHQKLLSDLKSGNEARLLSVIS